MAWRAGIAAQRVTIDGSLPDPGRGLGAHAQAIPAQRFGSADEFGALCAFICSVHAGYLTGQNLLLDGGAYPGTF
jgi:3-oxoacyl-[acyl-carrier protein] reductase